MPRITCSEEHDLLCLRQAFGQAGVDYATSYNIVVALVQYSPLQVLNDVLSRSLSRAEFRFRLLVIAMANFRGLVTGLASF